MAETLLLEYHVRAWEKYLKLYPSLRNLTIPEIKFNNRTYRCAGQNYPTLNKIEISRKLFEQHKDTILHITVPHEIAHQVDYNLHGMPPNKRRHHKLWKDIMVKYGLPPDIYHTMEYKK